MFKPNSEDRPPPKLIENDALVEEAKREYGGGVRFIADANEYEAVFVLKACLDAVSRDDNDRSAMAHGFTHICRMIARGFVDRLPYAVWEFYCSEDNNDYLSKVLEVDCEHQRRGIGTAFVRVVQKSLSIRWSGTQTPAGANFLNKLNAESP